MFCKCFPSLISISAFRDAYWHRFTDEETEGKDTCELLFIEFEMEQDPVDSKAEGLYFLITICKYKILLFNFI